MPIMPPSTLVPPASIPSMDDAEKEANARMPVPEISRELIRWLRATNPIRSIGRDETIASANRRAGEQDLIDKLDYLSHLQALNQRGELDEDDKDLLVWDEEEPDGYVLRVS